MLQLPELVENNDLAIVMQHFTDEGPEPCIECGPGWNKIVVGLVNALESVYSNFKIYQIREKFGELRVYTDLPYWEEGESPSFAARMIFEAEQLSTVTCEMCGSQAEKVKTKCGEFKVLCYDCRPQEDFKR